MSKYYAIMITGSPQPHSLENILAYVSRVMGIEKTAIIAKNRKRKIVDSKALFCAIAYRTGMYTLTKVGDYVNLHHTTVIHHRRECVENFTMSKFARPIITNFFGEYRRDPIETKHK
jgi:chromosomal replication initiation ATPase DnaA